MSDAPLLEAAFPALTAEITAALRAEPDQAQLIEQVPELRVVDRCRCGGSFCATIKTARRGQCARVETVPLDSIAAGMVNLDLCDGRIVSIEVLDRDDVRVVLNELLPLGPGSRAG